MGMLPPVQYVFTLDFCFLGATKCPALQKSFESLSICSNSYHQPGLFQSWTSQELSVRIQDKTPLRRCPWNKVLKKHINQQNWTSERVTVTVQNLKGICLQKSTCCLYLLDLCSHSLWWTFHGPQWKIWWCRVEQKYGQIVGKYALNIFISYIDIHR